MGCLFAVGVALAAAPPPEKAIKAEFGYGFNEVMDKIVTVTCTSGHERSAGSGFVARQDGKTYLFTNQHVVFGADRIVFKTADGRRLRPASVELSATRDIARLLLNDGPEGFKIADTPVVGAPVAVFGNSEGGGVATELYGKVLKVGDDLIEVSATIVRGNSGSPVLDTNRTVVGIASFVRYFDNDKSGAKTQRFCYRLAGGRWSSVNWKKYNAKFGKQLIESKRLFDTTAALFEEWKQAPYDRISPSNYSGDPGLRGWAIQHNHMIDGMVKLIDKGEATPRKLNLANSQIKADICRSARILAFLCRHRAEQMRVQAKQPGLTGFLRGEFSRNALRFEGMALEVEGFGGELSKHDYFHFR